jgi:hypothetical protein
VSEPRTDGSGPSPCVSGRVVAADPAEAVQRSPEAARAGNLVSSRHLPPLEGEC